MLVSGISSPWPSDFMDNLLVRLGSQMVAPASVPADAPNDWQAYEMFVDTVRNLSCSRDSSSFETFLGLEVLYHNNAES
jgi:hypothetical protein